MKTKVDQPFPKGELWFIDPRTREVVHTITGLKVEEEKMPDERFADVDAIERYCQSHPDFTCDLPTEQVLNLIRMAKATQTKLNRALPQNVAEILVDVSDELERATKKFGAMHDAHHGYAVILEELDELWDEVKHRECSLAAMRIEAVQVAAMAVRFIQDVCDRKEYQRDWTKEVLPPAEGMKIDGEPHL